MYISIISWSGAFENNVLEQERHDLFERGLQPQ